MSNLGLKESSEWVVNSKDLPLMLMTSIKGTKAMERDKRHSFKTMKSYQRATSKETQLISETTSLMKKQLHLN